jgi:hypothetical protein
MKAGDRVEVWSPDPDRDAWVSEGSAVLAQDLEKRQPIRGGVGLAPIRRGPYRLWAVRFASGPDTRGTFLRWIRAADILDAEPAE